MYSLCTKGARAKKSTPKLFLLLFTSSPPKGAYERTGAIQLSKSEQDLGKLHRETKSHVFWGQTELLCLDGVE